MQIQNKLAAQQLQGRQMPLVSARMQTMPKPVRSFGSNASIVDCQQKLAAVRRVQRGQLVVRAYGPANGTTEKTMAPMSIIFVSAEVSPWSKTGGLGDVVGGLPVEVGICGELQFVTIARWPAILSVNTTLPVAAAG